MTVLNFLGVNSAGAETGYEPVELTAEQSISILEGMIDTVGEVLGGALPVALGLIAILIGLFFAFRFIKRQIGRAN